MRTFDPDRRERGQVLAIFALAVVAIIAMTGLVLDGGSTFVQRRDMQNAADAAAMAAGYAYVNTDSASAATAATVAAKDAAKANGYAEGTDGVVIDVVVTEMAAGTTVKVSMGKPHRNHFSGIVGMTTWDVSTTATSLSGPPNSAIGAAPLIFNEAVMPFVPNKPVWFSEPGTGTEDVPQGSAQFNWTIYCAATGNPCNANTSGVRALIEGTNQNGSPEITVDYEIGPLNAGAHADLFSALAALVPTEFPVAIVNNEGDFMGIAMFRLTGSVGGSTKKVQGYFLDGISGWQLRINPNNTPGTSRFGSYKVYLID